MAAVLYREALAMLTSLPKGVKKYILTNCAEKQAIEALRVGSIPRSTHSTVDAMHGRMSNVENVMNAWSLNTVTPGIARGL